VCCADVAGFCVGYRAQFAGECDADDQIGFAFGKEAVAEVCEGWIMIARDGGDNEQDVAHRCPAAVDMAFAAVIGQVCGASDRGCRARRVGAKRRQVGQERGDGADGHTFHMAL